MRLCFTGLSFVNKYLSLFQKNSSASATMIPVGPRTGPPRRRLRRRWRAGERGVVNAFDRKHKKKFLGRFVEFRPAVRLYGEGRATGPPKDLRLKTVTGEQVMPQYLVANYLP